MSEDGLAGLVFSVRRADISQLPLWHIPGDRTGNWGLGGWL